MSSFSRSWCISKHICRHALNRGRMTWTNTCASTLTELSSSLSNVVFAHSYDEYFRGTVPTSKFSSQCDAADNDSEVGSLNTGNLKSGSS